MLQPSFAGPCGARLLRVISLAALVAVPAGFAQGQQPAPGIAPVVLDQPQYIFDTAEQHRLKVVVVARGLVHPFSVVLLPDGDALVSQRGGALRLVRNATGSEGRPATLEAASGGRSAGRGRGLSQRRPARHRVAPGFRTQPARLLHVQQAR